MKVIVFYKCRWCGVTKGELVNALSVDEALETADKIAVHDCSRGRTGVIDLVGAREAKEGEG